MYREFTTQPYGQYTKYEVRALNGPPGFQFIAAGVVLTPPVTGATWHPTEAQFLGEVDNHDDQMPGGARSRVQLNDVQFSHDLRSWTDVKSAAIVSPSSQGVIYGSQYVSSGTYRIWDRDCF